MGIKNGWDLGEGYCSHVNISDFKGAVLAIGRFVCYCLYACDGVLLLKQLFVPDVPIIIKQLEASGSDIIRGVLRRVLHLMANGVRPLMVFEGASVTEEKRRLQVLLLILDTTSYINCDFRTS